MAIDAQIAALALHGNVTRQQLLVLGLGHHAIAYRVKAGRLHRVHIGVYGVGRPPKTALERTAAALLACGPQAGLSHFTAMALWGFAKRWPRTFEVSTTANRRPAGIVVHRSSTLDRRDFTKHHGLRVTTPARTLLDCAPALSDQALVRAVNDALLSRYMPRSALAELLARHPRHRGTRRLLPFLDDSGGPTRSEFEDAFPAFCERYGLPRPRMNMIVGGREVDAYFEAERVIVELDGFRFHSGRAAFERDRENDANAIAAGIVTVRITWQRMLASPAKEAARLLMILEARRG